MILDKTVWKSFHKTLILKKTETWLSSHLRRYKWPLEVHIMNVDNTSGYSFMGFIDLFTLLYPGGKNFELSVFKLNALSYNFKYIITFV